MVQGIQLICDCWFYCIEWMSPGISENGDASGVSEFSSVRENGAGFVPNRSSIYADKHPQKACPIF
ncbi:hypothetical protein [uncultured Nostoc sp.]|uniref:hypothetical protein n=1 Tax=uncultured Nostoc sp. TaxID=340711 RepID=UPI0035C94DC4